MSMSNVKKILCSNIKKKNFQTDASIVNNWRISHFVTSLTILHKVMFVPSYSG